MSVGAKNIGVAMDFSTSSKCALQWALDNLAQKGESVIIIHIKSGSPDESRDKIWAESGARKYIYISSWSLQHIYRYICIYTYLIWWLLQLWFHCRSSGSRSCWRSMSLKLISSCWICWTRRRDRKRFVVFMFLFFFLFIWSVLSVCSVDISGCFSWRWWLRFTGEMQGRSWLKQLKIWNLTL